MMLEPVCSTSELLPLPIVIAVPTLLCTSPALMIVVLPLSVRMAEPFWLMICPPARFWIVAVKLEPTVFENTASEPRRCADRAAVDQLVVVALKISALLDAPVVDSVPLLLMVPLPPRIDAARALLPEVDTVPLLINVLFNWPELVCPHAASCRMR